MPEHTKDPFDTDGNITEPQRSAALNAALHIHNNLSEEARTTRGVAALIEDADAISRFLNDGSPAAS